MRTTTVLASLLASAVFAFSATAQNLVRNGEFTTNTNGWKQSGYALLPQVASVDLTGIGKDPAFSCVAGQKVFNVPVTFDLEQTVSVRKEPMEFSMDVGLWAWIGNGSLGLFEVTLGNQKIASLDFGSSLFSAIKRARICARFVPAIAGNQTLKISLSRRARAVSGITPTHYLDNVSLRAVGGPTLCVAGERKVGQSATFGVEGRSRCAFAVFVAPKVAAAPIRVHGFGGRFGLNLTATVWFAAGALDASGKASVTVPTIPASVAGVPLHWQAVELCTSSREFGLVSRFGFYR